VAGGFHGGRFQPASFFVEEAGLPACLSDSLTISPADRLFSGGYDDRDATAHHDH